MPIEILGDAMHHIAAAQQDPEELGSGFGGRNGPAEGPVWWKEGGFLLFSDIHGSRRMKWEPDKGISVDQDGTANANGMTRDRLGRLVVCHHFSRIISHSTNVVEHPELVAWRIKNYASVVGRENVIAGTDCGFAQGWNMIRVHPEVQWAKLRALVEGAALASHDLWGRH